jgi:hypothetical protein
MWEGGGIGTAELETKGAEHSGGRTIGAECR